MTLADRVVVMRQGRVEQIAPPRQLYAKPASTFVAEFFGAPRINLLPPALLAIAAPSPLLTLGLRPEHVTVSKQPSEGAIAARVYLVEPLGAETWVTVEIGPQKVVGRAAPSFDGQSGDPVFVHIETDGLLWFDEAGRSVRADE
jgi:multiple sugar transport system ATP-binding protein